jgi:uncharacterized protein (TIGR00730 family)
MRICVFAGSAAGSREAYARAARELGTAIARRGHGLVYGGAAHGLMGLAASAALSGGARVVGVLPRFLREREIAHRGLTELREVATLHERKALMGALSDAVVALPGGMGTLDELFEVLTWRQLGLHEKPIGLLDAAGYYQPLLGFLRGIASEGFVAAAAVDALVVRADAESLLDALGAG